MKRLIIISALLSVCFAQTYDSEIQPIWDNNCTSSCHISSSLNGGLNLSSSTSYSELVNVASQGWPAFMRVKSGDSMNSVLHQKIVGNSSFGDRMPKGGSLSQADEQKIKTWIDNGAPQDWSGGGSDHSLSFDGVDDYVEIDNSLSYTTLTGSSAITLSVSFKRKSGTGWQGLWGNNQSNWTQISIRIDDQNYLSLGYKDISGFHDYSLDDRTIDFDKWYNLSVVLNANKILWYLDGDLIEEDNVSFTELSSYGAGTPEFSIGRGNKTYGEYFNGNIDNVNLWNIALSSSSIKNYLNAPPVSAASGLIASWVFNDGSGSTVSDQSGNSFTGTIYGATWSTDTPNTGGSMTEGIDVSYKSSDTFGGKVRIGYVPQGNDPNYWTSVTHKWEMGDHSFPGDYTAKVWNSNINDGEAHLIVFVDSDNNDQWDNATEYGAISQVFQVTNKQGYAGTLTLMKGGGGGGTPNTIEIVVKLNQNIGNGDVHVGVWYPGSNSAPDLVDNLDNQATPSPDQGWNFQLSGSGIIPSGGPYKVEAFFDQNNNDMPDGGEFIVNLDDIYTDSQGYAYSDIDLGGGGISPNLRVSLTVEGVPDGTNGQAIIDVLRKSDETLIQGFQFGETTPITDMHKEFNVQGVSNGETVFLKGWYNGNNSELLAEGQSNTFDWPPSGDIDLVLEKGTYSGPLKATVTVNGTNDSGSLSFRIFSPGTVITDELPDLINAVYGHDETVVYSSPPSNEKIEINDFLNGFAFDTYEYVVWYDVDLDEGFDPAVDPFSAGPLVLSSGQPAEINPVLNILPGPSINASNLMGLTPNEGEDLTISVDVTAHSSPLAGAVGSVSIIYYTGSGINGDHLCNSSTSGTYDCTIPGNDITNAGLAIGMNAFDEYGAVSSVGPYDVAVQFTSINITSVPAESYIMISIPANLSNASINGVVGDELGERDPKVWRSFKWINGTYQEHAGNLALGSAVWLISKDGIPINADNGYSTALVSGTTINLSNGWNQVGNPYNFSIQLTDDSQVQLHPTVEQKLYQYSGGENYTESTIMQPGTGYWIYSSDNGGHIKFNPIFGFNSSSKQLASKTTIGWKATIEVVAGSQKDGVTTFGLHPEASNDYDQQDFHEPPVIGEYITAYFNHPEVGSLSQDIRADNQDLYKWPLSIRTNQRGIAEISIPDIYEIPSYFEVKLYDPISQIVYDMRDEPSIFFTSQGTGNPHYFDLLVGSAHDIQNQLNEMGIIPSSFELAQNTPNPFNPVTNIRVSLIEAANITLKVYNLLGEEMNAIAVNQSLGKGNHRFIWAGKHDNGRQLPSGIYLYRLEVMSQSGIHLYQDTKKMVLMK